MKFPTQCPACDTEMTVVKLSCLHCQTDVLGKFDLPAIVRLDQQDQEFILEFLLNSGSLKEMAVKMGKSYPTVRNRLDELIGKVRNMQQSQSEV